MKKNILLIAMVAISLTINGQNETVNGNLQVNGRVNGGFGAYTTNGVLDWNDITNAISGSGYSLLLGSTALNSPGGSNVYYHPFNFEYSSKNGSGNITQLAIPYGVASGINNGIWMRGRYSNSWTSWVKILSENLQGRVGIGTTTPSSSLHVKSSVNQTNSLDDGIGLMKTLGGDYSIQVTSNNGIPHIDLANSPNEDYDMRLAVYYDNKLGILGGNVGVGIANPDYALDIESSNDDFKQLRVKSPGSPLIKLSGSYNSGNGAEFWQNASGDVRLNVNSTTSGLFIKSNGNLGVGTSAPNSKLSIRESDLEVNFLMNKKLEGTWPSTQENNTLTFQASGSSAGNIAFASGNSEMMRISASGNLGIGTTNPLYKLHIHESGTTGSVPPTRIHLTNSETGTAWNDGLQIIQNGVDQNYKANFLLRENAQMAFWTNNIERFTIDKTGNIGIGTTNPLSKLHVKGTATIENLNLRKTDGSGTAGFDLSGTGTYIHIAGDGIIPKNNGVQDIGIGGWRFRNLNLESTAYIGNGVVIGTNQIPSGYRLAVKGKVIAEEVKVETGWSDFVFEKDYDLPTLKEVENHIKEKGHLKDIPSAQEVAENGILLGQMDSKLLQKIEELTLYTIAQEKKIHSLEKMESEMKEIKKQNKELKLMLQKINDLLEKQK